MESEENSSSTKFIESAETVDRSLRGEEMENEESKSTTNILSSSIVAAVSPMHIEAAGPISDLAPDDDDAAYQPSEYELQRLERIRRNQEYLASLGLEALKQPQEKKKKKSTEADRPQVERRPRSSRLQGKEFNFNIEELFNMRKMLSSSVVDASIYDDVSGSFKGPPSEQSPEISNDNLALGNQNNNNDTATEKKIKYREFVSKELRRMQTERRLNLRASERNMRAVEKELRIAEREYTWVAKRKNREEEAKKKRIQWEELRLSTIIDTELSRLREERNIVQKNIEVVVRNYHKESLTALESVQDSFSQKLQLSCVFLEEYASRYSSCTKEYQCKQRQTCSSTTTTKRGSPMRAQHSGEPKQKPSSSLRSEYPSEFFLASKENLPLHDDVLPSDDVAMIDRSWLELDTQAKNNASHQIFVPQVDDLVVYYPMGHKAFLSQFFEVRKKIMQRSTRYSSSSMSKQGEKEPYSYLKYFEKNGFDESLAGGVLCIVKEAYAEFPSQDYRKFDENSVPFLIYNRQKNIPMALSVTLMPITDSSGHCLKEKTKRPTFTFQLFPTVSPFCIPIHWALDASNISVGDHVRHRTWRSHGQVLFVRSGLPIQNSSALLSLRFNEFPFEAMKDSFKGNYNSDTEPSGKTMSLDGWILPLWNCLDIVWEDGTYRSSSPWEITVAQFADSSGRPSRRSHLSNNNQRQTNLSFCSPWTMTEEVRSKIEDALTKFIRTHDSIQFFLDDVTETVAPGYSSFVPLPMCFRKVLKRIKLNDDDFETTGCYYRSILSLTSDLKAIYRNCCLYNYQGSDITKLCQKTVMEALNCVRSSHMEVFEHQINTLRSIEQPKKSPIDTRWCGGSIPDASWIIPGCSRNPANYQTSWIPQVGDDVIYDRSLHEKFMQHHKLFPTAESSFFSNAAEQAKIVTNVLKGKIIDIYPLMFPEDDIRNLSFPKPSSVLSITLEFSSSKTQMESHCYSVLWRPCILRKTSEGLCSCSGSSSTFLSPAWIYSESPQPTGVDKESQEAIIYCLETLRYRCSLGLSFDKMDDEMTRKLQYLKRQTDVNLWLSSGEGIFLPEQTTGNASEARHMSKCFSNSSKIIKPQNPNPHLSVELVLSRLKNHYYRQLSAAENDVKLAFSLMSSHLLDNPTVSSRDASTSVGGTAVSSQHVAKIKYKPPYRSDDLNLKIYGTAFLCISMPSYCSIAFGFVSTQGLFVRMLPLKEHAYRLDKVIYALGKDPCDNHRPISNDEPYPTVTIHVRCGGAVDDDLFSLPSSASSEEDVSPATINMSPSLYQNEERIAVALYGKPERRLPCARCMLLGHNFLHCRVRCGHSNPSVCTEELYEPYGLSNLFNNPYLGVRMSGGKLCRDSETAEAADDSYDQNVLERAEMLEKAKLAHQLAEVALADAKATHESPLELTDHFIKSYFPIDPKDGHYLFCTVCGYGGDMLVCEGCPVVAHADCYGLTSIPHDDWYCNKCCTKQHKAMTPEIQVAGDAEKTEGDAINADRLEKLLEELKSYRLSKIVTKEKGSSSLCEDDSIPPEDGQQTTAGGEGLHQPVPVMKNDRNVFEHFCDERPQGGPLKSKPATQNSSEQKNMSNPPDDTQEIKAEAEGLQQLVPVLKDDAKFLRRNPVARPLGRPRKSETATYKTFDQQDSPEDLELYQLASAREDVVEYTKEIPMKKPRGRPRKDIQDYRGKGREFPKPTSSSKVAALKEKISFKRSRGRPPKNASIFHMAVDAIEVHEIQEREGEQSMKDPPTANRINLRKRPRSLTFKTDSLSTLCNELTRRVKGTNQPIGLSRGRPPKVEFPSPCSIEGSIFDDSCQGEVVRKGRVNFYVAKENDQISSLAKSFEVTVDSLISYNIQSYPTLKRNSRLKAYTRLRLPPHSNVNQSHLEKSITIACPTQGASKTDNSESCGTEFTTTLSIPVSATSQTGQASGNGCVNDYFEEVTSNLSNSSICESALEGSTMAINEIQEDNFNVSIRNESHRDLLVELPVDTRANQSLVIQMPQVGHDTPQRLGISCPPFIPTSGCRRLLRVKLPTD